MAFRKIETNAPLFTFEKIGDKVEGIYKGCRKVETEVGESVIHDLDTKDGPIAFFGSAMLNPTLAENVAAGNTIRITFTGTKPPKKKGYSPLRIFTVEIDE